MKWHKLHHHHRDEPNTEYMSKRRPHDKYMKSQRNRTMTLAFVCFLPSIHRYWVAGACLAAEHALNTYTRTHWRATQLPKGDCERRAMSHSTMNATTTMLPLNSLSITSTQCYCYYFRYISQMRISIAMRSQHTGCPFSNIYRSLK